MNQATLEPRYRFAQALAERAGEFLLEHFGRVRTVDSKRASVDLVTEADRGAEDLIRQAVLDEFPNDRFIGEEGGIHGLAECEWSWIVDPLDGTTNFVHAVPHFSVSIAIARKGRPVGGVVRHPHRGCTYHAQRGKGAFVNEQPITVSNESELGRVLVATGFPYDRQERANALLEPFARVMRVARGVRRMGAASLDLVDVAQGIFGGYWEPGLSPWDTAAGIVLVEEAGGHVSAYGGAPFALDCGTIVASNGRVHQPLVELVGS